MINIRPVNARTLVKPLPKEEFTVGSLILPDGAAGLEEGIVQKDFSVTSAEGVTVLVKTGEKIIYPENHGILQLVNGTHLRWVTINDIWGVVSEDIVKQDKGDSL